MSRPIVDTGTHYFLNRLPSALAIALLISTLLSSAATAQQPTRQKTPRMTSDDVAKPPAEKPSESKSEGALAPEEASKAAQSKQADVKISPEETSWRDRVNQARDRAKAFERAAEQAELRTTSLRNDLGVSGQSAKYRNEVAAEMEIAGARLTEARRQASAAADDLAQLLDYGKEKGFTEGEGPKPTLEEGKPNEDYYRTQLAKLKEAIEGAQRRIELYQNRVNDISQRILMNGGKNGGDNFFLFQLQKDREEAQQKLDESRAALAKSQNDLESLREEARRAGVTPDVFR